MRVEPLPLTTARRELQGDGRIVSIRHSGVPWFHLNDADPKRVQDRLKEQAAVYKKITRGSLSKLIGQALEIAVYRALDSQSELDFYGGFLHLDAHDDSTLYTKEEPPSIVSGRDLPGSMKLDFLLNHNEAGHAGVEVKNVRQWLYPNRDEIRDLLLKCCAIDAVPVLIARRIPYVTFTEVFKPCGIIIHETLNQRFPDSKKDLADQAKDKMLLGYHDVRMGNQPDVRLNHFIHDLLPKLLPRARKKFNDHRDILERFGTRSIDYPELHVELYTKWGHYGTHIDERVDGFDESELYEPPDEEPDGGEY